MTLADLALLLVGFFVLVQATDRQALAKGLREGFGGAVADSVQARPDPARRRRGRRSRPARPSRTRPRALIDFAAANLRDPRASLRVSGGTVGAGRCRSGDRQRRPARRRPRARIAAYLIGHGIAADRIIIAAAGTGRRTALVTVSFTGDRQQDKAMIRSSSLLLPLVAVATPAAAQAFQSTTLIDQAVAGFTGTRDRRGRRRAHPGRYAAEARACPMVTMTWRTARARRGGGGVPRSRMAHLRARPHRRAGAGRGRARSPPSPRRRAPSRRSSSSAATR